jgi:hypothetical protein
MNNHLIAAAASSFILGACGGSSSSDPAPVTPPVLPPMALVDPMGNANVLTLPVALGAAANLTGTWKTYCIAHAAGAGGAYSSYTKQLSFAAPTSTGLGAVFQTMVQYPTTNCSGSNSVTVGNSITAVNTESAISGLGEDFTGSALLMSFINGANGEQVFTLRVGFVSGGTTQARITTYKSTTEPAPTFSHNQEIFYKQ